MKPGFRDSGLPTVTLTLLILISSTSLYAQLGTRGQTITAEALYQIHQLSEQDVLQTYTTLLRDACHFADRDWKTSTFDPAAGYWGNGVSTGNEGILFAGQTHSCPVRVDTPRDVWAIASSTSMLLAIRR